MESISFTSNDDRMLCYTDRRNLYLQLHSSKPERTDGLVRGNNKLILDFAVSGETRYENSVTELFPDYFIVSFKKTGAKVKCALLRNALYFQVLTYGTSDALVLSLPPEYISRADSYTGLACSSTVKIEPVAGDRSLRKYSFPAQTPLYISFQRSPAEANAHATLLLNTNGFESHCNEIQQALAKFHLDTGNRACTSALEWASISGLSLVTTKNKVTGIWAGLPWFRDNWGRDTFISLPGILFATGQFETARNVIKGFLQFQDRDPDSPTYGRIPNRYNGTSIIYNTADGPLWLIREILEYAYYTGDRSFLQEEWDAISLSIQTDITRRTDSFGLLRHGNADTWMDARISGQKAWSPRGNRANDVQVLWYTALECAATIASLLNHQEEHDAWHALAQQVKKNFLKLFWNGKQMADHIDVQGKGDYRTRPNQLMLLTIPFDGNTFISEAIAKKITETTVKELLFPYGICSLTQHDSYFHPYHDNCPRYHKDAAYHNGTIWGWNAGFTIGALCMTGHQNLAWEFTKNLADQILNMGCAGTMSENISAYPNDDGSIHLSGTWSQAWSDAEFNRAFRDYFLGIHPDMLHDRIIITPHFPDEWKTGSATIPLGIESKACILYITWSEKSVTLSFSSSQVNKLQLVFSSGLHKITQTLTVDRTLQIKLIYRHAHKETLHFAKPVRMPGSGDEPPCLTQQDYLAKVILSDYGISEA